MLRSTPLLALTLAFAGPLFAANAARPADSTLPVSAAYSAADRMQDEPSRAEGLPSGGLPVSAVGRLPLAFAENHGRMAHAFRYVADSGNLSLGIAPDRAALRLGPASSGGGAPPQPQLTLRLLGAQRTARVRGLSPLPGVLNLYRGSDPRGWRTGLSTFARVRSEAVYPGIDLDYYSRAGRLEYDFTVAPGGHPNRIRLHFDGASEARLGARGELVLRARGTELRWRPPVSYQVKDGRKEWVASRYALARDGTVRFHLGRYDRRRPLVIDPVLEFSTTAINGGIFVDSAGNVLIAEGSGVTRLNSAGGWISQTLIVGSDGSSPGFGQILLDAGDNIFLLGTTQSTSLPASNSAFGHFDAYVAKLTSTGILEFGRYYGGLSADTPYGIALDSGGSLWIAGRTVSADLPLVHELQGYNPGEPGVARSMVDGFLARMSADGQDLLFSTYFGGSRADWIQSVAVAPGPTDPATVYLGGYSESIDLTFPNGIYPNMPPQEGSGDPRFDEGDSFAMKLEVPNAGPPTIVWSTTLGGEGFDQPCRMVMDGNGRLYMGGLCGRAFPHSQDSGDGTAFYGVYVVRLDDEGVKPAIGYSRLIGGNAQDHPYWLAVDPEGRAAIVGFTYSTDFPLRDPLDGVLNFPSGWRVTDGFVSVFGTSGELLFSSYLGGDGSDSASAVAMDAQSNVYVGGGSEYRYNFQKRSSFPFPATPGALAGNGDRWTIKVSLRPAAAAGLTASALPGGQNALTWSNPTSNQSLVRVARSTETGPFTEVAVLDGGATTYADSGLTARTTYRYRLQSENEFGVSPYSSVVSATARR